MWFFYFHRFLYGLGNDDSLFWIALIVIGIILVFFGYTIEAYDLNNKVAKILINLWDNIKNFEWRKIPGRIASLIAVIFVGIGSYMLLGIKKFRFVLRNSFLAVYSFFMNSLRGLIRLILSIPHYTKRFFIFCYEYNYWLIIPLFLIAFLKLTNIGLPSVTLFILAFLYLLLVVLLILHSNEELAQRYLEIIRKQSWETVQSISIRIQKTTSSIGKYKCQNCKVPLRLGQEICDNCKNEVKQCSICKLPIKPGQETATCSNCQHINHSNHWDQWIRMGHNCPICHSA